MNHKNDNNELLKNRKVLLKIAQESILEHLQNSNILNENELLQKYPCLELKRATFVTLNLEGNLRGCIGSLIPQRTLLEDIISNAKAAAFQDPRFHPLTKEEFDHVEIEISVLTVPTLLEYNDIKDMKEKVRSGIDGIILKQGNHQATFLPQVWDQLPQFEDFFAHLCQKAGLHIECLNNHPQIYIYQALKVKE